MSRYGYYPESSLKYSDFIYVNSRVREKEKIQLSTACGTYIVYLSNPKMSIPVHVSVMVTHVEASDSHVVMNMYLFGTVSIYICRPTVIINIPLHRVHVEI